MYIRAIVVKQNVHVEMGSATLGISMSKGPRGEAYLGNVVGCAAHVAKMATGEIEDTKLKHPAKHNSGVVGDKARAKLLGKTECSNIAKAVANARWVARSQD